MRRLVFALVGMAIAVAVMGCGKPAVIEKGVVLKGYGEIKSVPDTGEFTVVVVTRDIPSAGQRANDANRKKVEAVRQALTNQGVASKDVATDLYEAGIQRPTDWNTGKPLKAFYRVTNSFTVTLRDVKKLGKTIDSCIRAGATKVESVSYSFSRQAELEAQAMAAAVTDAKTRAEKVAQAGGVILLPISSVIDADLAAKGEVWSPYDAFGASDGKRYKARPALRQAKPASTGMMGPLAKVATTYAAPREESITADVVVTFAIQRR